VNSLQIIDTTNCVKSTTDVYSAYNNEKTRLNFGIFYTIIKNRWSNVASQWNSDKIFNVVGHYAAAKKNFITVIATEIDYEDINKPPSTNISNSDSFNPQSDLINRFYSSLDSNNQSLITSSNNTNNVKLENDSTPITPFFETTNPSTSTIPIASTSSTSTENRTKLQNYLINI